MSETTAEEPASPVDETRQRARRWLRVLLLASLAVFLIVVCAELSQPAPADFSRTQTRHPGPDDRYIIAGQRVGFLRLGLSIAAVEQRLGRGQAKPTATAVLYRFNSAGITCAVQRGQVASILIHNPNFVTPYGTAVGSDADAVVRELGDQYEYETPESTPAASPTPGSRSSGPYTLHYWREGIHLTLNQDKVESILITPPGAP